MPEEAWSRLAAACDQNEPLPAPVGHAAAVGGLSSVATLTGAAVESGSTVGGVVLHTLAAVAGYVGAAVLTTLVTPMLIRSPSSNPGEVERFASAAVIPLAASGILCVVPFAALGLVWAAVGATLTGRSAWIGASAMLGLERKPRRDAAALVTTLGTAPVLLGLAFRLTFAP